MTNDLRAVARINQFKKSRFDNQFAEGVPSYSLMKEKVYALSDTLHSFVEKAGNNALIDVIAGKFHYTDEIEELNQKYVFETFERNLQLLLSKFIPGQRSEVWRILKRSDLNSRANTLNLYALLEKVKSRSFLFTIKLTSRYVT